MPIALQSFFQVFAGFFLTVSNINSAFFVNFAFQLCMGDVRAAKQVGGVLVLVTAAVDR